MSSLISDEYPLVVTGSSIRVYDSLKKFLEALDNTLKMSKDSELMFVWVHGYGDNKLYVELNGAEMKENGMTLESAINYVLNKDVTSIKIHFTILADRTDNSPPLEFDCFSGIIKNRNTLTGKAIRAK
jgi:hypothetical protein